MKYHNATYLKARRRELRAVGLCADCKAPSVRFVRCRDCRERVNATRRKAA